MSVVKKLYQLVPKPHNFADSSIFFNYYYRYLTIYSFIHFFFAKIERLHTIFLQPYLLIETRPSFLFSGSENRKKALSCG